MARPGGVLALRDAEDGVDVLGRILVLGADRRDQRGELGLVPIDLLRQIGDHRDLAVLEADRAGVLALGAAGRGGPVAVAERDGAVQPVGEMARRLRGLLGLLLQQREHGAGSAAISPIGMVRMSPSWGRLAGAFTYAASSVMVRVAKSGSAPLRRGRAMAK